MTPKLADAQTDVKPSRQNIGDCSSPGSGATKGRARRPAFVQIPREFFNGDLWNDPAPYHPGQAVIDLWQSAAWKSELRDGVQLERGELLVSSRDLAKRWHWPRTNVQRFIASLVTKGHLVLVRSGHSGSVYHVVNYHDTTRATADAGQHWATERATERATSEFAKPLIESVLQDQQANERATERASDRATKKLVVQELQEEKLSAASASVARVTWITPYADAWKAQYGGDMPIGPSLRPLQKAHTALGADEAARRWRIYLSQTGAQFASAARFAATLDAWKTIGSSNGNGSGVDPASMTLFQRYTAHGLLTRLPRDECVRIAGELVSEGLYPSIDAFLDELRITQPWTLNDCGDDRRAARLIAGRLAAAPQRNHSALRIA